VLEYPGAGERKVADFERLLRGLRVWMLGAPETTVVTGLGLGPDLLKPLPLVMARRRGTEARFITLLEPFAEAPAVTTFRGSPEEWLEITGAGFHDLLAFDAAGVLRYVRRVEGAVRRLALSGATRLEQGGQVLLELAAAVPAQVDLAEGQVEILLGDLFSGELRLLAPGISAVRLNGQPAECRRDGDYCVVNVRLPN
jgi:hypothetical protein